MSNIELHLSNLSTREDGPDPDAMMPDLTILESNPKFKEQFGELIRLHLEKLETVKSLEQTDPDGSWRMFVSTGEEYSRQISELCQEHHLSDAKYWHHTAVLAVVHFQELARGRVPEINDE
jgi:hypothetical protein